MENKIGKIKAPFPYFGNKFYACESIWKLAKSETIGNFIDPFCGSASVLLNRPNPKERTIETLNDNNGFIVNYLRANRDNPKGLCKIINRPVAELDYHASWKYVANQQGKKIVKKLNDNIDFYDLKLAGLYAYSLICAINDHASKLTTKNTPYKGINNAIPNVGSRSIGIGNAYNLENMLNKIADRLKYVRTMCGDWKRTITPAMLSNTIGGKYVFVYLDPPYKNSEYLYGAEKGLSKSVEKWAIENGNKENLKIIIAGYNGEHDELLKYGWEKIKSKAAGRTFTKAEMSDEQMWYNPIIVKDVNRLSLF